ncbi:MAG: PAS domain S-box protein [Clostridia bacterium]|nr:PAS domain S-box protein [Clostridia bacterium]
MVSALSVVIFSISLIIVAYFIVWSRKTQKKRALLNKLFLFLSLAYSSWVIPLIIMRFVGTDNNDLMFFLDCLMQPGGALMSPLYLCIAISFVEGYEKMKTWMKLLFIFPLITVLISWTNPLHHLYYVEFSVVKSEIIFGPYILVSGAFNYIFLISGIVYMIRFGLKNKTSLYWKQCVMFIISGLCPFLVSVAATFSGQDIPITATPLSFMVTLIFNGIAIFQLHVLDISPIATQHVLNAISDSYIVLSETGLVVKYNRSFQELFGKEYGIVEGTKLSDCLKIGESSQKNVIYSLLAAVDSSKEGESHISYEQSVTFTVNDVSKKYYFVVDVSPLELYGQITGYVVLFKDITQLRESMKRLQDSQERMMEQERFAFLGQMIGGLAHNLKTPIMSISGCISAAENLVEECEESLTDSDVTADDYREIYDEMKDWFSKVKESTAYMSDIITAIKGQAANISTDDKITFTIDEMLKRCTLLMRHELLNSGCRLNITYDKSEEISLQGDINNLIQVIGNLLSNSIYAQKQVGGGDIDLVVKHDDTNLEILVNDRGTGVPENVLAKLFKSMVTSKGALGTGLGLYMSNAVIRGKFNGEMWGENREGGGSTFGIRIPLDIVHIRTATASNGEDQ